MGETAALLPEQADIQQAMFAILERQRRAQHQEGVASARTRIERIGRAIAMLESHRGKLCEAMASDFGHRSMHQSGLMDIFGSLIALKDAKRNLRKWMRPERRKPMFPLGLLGSRARIEYQPLGVVGCISPWNFPVLLTLTPLAGILAAGNRMMIKLSEFSPATSELMKELFAGSFDVEEVAVFTGGPETGAAFSRLPFDHLIFTGSASVAKQIMRAASENLVPVTLELGGKSPVVIGRSADMTAAAGSVMMGKTVSAGQICLSPDYALVPREQAGEFVDASRAAVARMFPRIKDNPDYTSIVNERHYNRITGYIEDARQKGATVVEINPAGEDFGDQRHYRIPPTLLLDATDEMKVMQEEVFGPVLPVIKYSTIDEALACINKRPRPLALYYFGEDRKEQETVLTGTVSGGVTINDVMMHASQDDLPFGGVGPSGMGCYHGIHGFKTFSHARGVYTPSKLVRKLTAVAMRPPYK